MSSNDDQVLEKVIRDECVVPGATYELVLCCEEEEPIRLRIRAETYARVLCAWKALEIERGETIAFDAFFSEACRRYLARSVTTKTTKNGVE